MPPGAAPPRATVRPTPSQLLAEVDRLTRRLARAEDDNRRLAALADEDPLCGILNRRGFDREFRRTIAHAARYATPAALVLVDLDDFKSVNDGQGHAAGDALLRSVALALRGTLRDSDVVARIGGDEFALILWHARIEDARTAAARILAVLPSPASAGIAAIAGPSAAAIFEAADADLYVAKRARRSAG